MLVSNIQEKSLGTLAQNRIYEFHYEITNKTNKEILAASWASCGCTIPVLEQNPIPAGATVKLTARFDTTGKLGKVKKSLGLNYDVEGVKQQLSVKFTAEVK